MLVLQVVVYIVLRNYKDALQHSMLLVHKYLVTKFYFKTSWSKFSIFYILQYPAQVKLAAEYD